MGRPCLSLQREVTLSPWLQWNPTSHPGGHLQLRTHLGVNNHWRSGTAHIQEPSSHLLGERFLELHKASRFETRVPDTCNSSSSVLQLQLLMRFARLLKAWSSLWAASPFTSQHLPILTSQGRSTSRERESRSATSSRTHVSLKPPER